MKHFSVSLFVSLVGLSIPAGAGEFRFERLDDRVVVLDGDELFTEYRFTERRPCLFPVLGPGGHSMTRRWPLAPDPARPESQDHLHHAGIWYAHGDVRIAGTELKGDFWHKESIEHQRFLDFDLHAADDSLVTENSWKLKDGTELCRDQTRIRFGKDDQARWIDFEVTLMAPADQAILLGDTKEGTMSIRVPETMTIATNNKELRHLSKGKITNSEGVTGGKAWGKKAKWCAYHGPVEGEETVIAIFDHPGNPRHPTWWMARTYGLFAANPFGQSYFEKVARGSGDFTLPAGESVTFRYRFLFQAGAFDAEKIETQYGRFAAAKAAQWQPLGSANNLDAWTSKPTLKHWSIKDGVITGANGPEKRGSVLWTKAEYGDFILETDFRFSGMVDSGVFIKETRYQVNLGISSSMKKDMTCSIYAPQDGRGKYPGQAEGIPELFREDDWNTLRVEARNKQILVMLNGTQVLDYETLALQEKGPIGLQVHGGLDMKIEFRNPRIQTTKQ